LSKVQANRRCTQLVELRLSIETFGAELFRLDVPPCFDLRQRIENLFTNRNTSGVPRMFLLAGQHHRVSCDVVR